MKKRYFFSCFLLILIVSCSSVPKIRAVNDEQVAVSSEQAAGSSEQVTVNSEQLTGNNEQLTVNSEQVAVNPEAAPEKPEAADELSLLEPESPSQTYVAAMENLRPAEPPHPAVPERRPAAPRKSPPAPAVSPKDEIPEIAQEPLPTADDQLTPAELERVLQPDYPMTFSRVARVTVGQLVEIPFRGKDWVFLGEVGARRGIAYDSRKMEPEGESFIFRVDASGVYALKFYKQDFARDLILNDHVQIIAGGTPETSGMGWFNPSIDRGRVVVGPRWPNFLEQMPQRIESPAEQQLSRAIEEQPVTVQPSTTAQPPAVAQPPVTARPPATAQPPATTRPTTTAQASAAPQPPAAKPPATAKPTTTAQPPVRQPAAAKNETLQPQSLSSNAIAQATPAPPSTPSPAPVTAPAPVAEPVTPDSVLKQAREEFSAGRIASAITLLDQYRTFYPSGSDEVWWLYGQCFEANSPNRNMLTALEYYRRLVREYPQSSRLSDARRRITYLERYYINIQ